MRSLLTAIAILITTAAPAESPDRKLTKAIAGGDYLLRIQEDNGRFLYSYDPDSPETRERYNWLRHAGTTYSLAQLYQVTREERFRTGAQRAAAYMGGKTESLTVEEKTYRVVMTNLLPGSDTDRGKIVKTGGVAMGVLALWSADAVAAKPAHGATLQQLAEYLLFIQQPNGEIRSQYIVPRGMWDKFRSEYYPGQVLLAFALLEETLPDPRYRKALRLALGDRIRLWSRPGGPPAYDHWGLIGVSRALPLLSDEEVLESLGMTRAAALQVLLDYAATILPRQVDDGSFAPAAGSVPATGTRLEALHAVRRLVARPSPDDKPAPQEVRDQVSAWGPAIDKGQTFLLDCSFTATEAAVYADGGVDITGGFRGLCNANRPGARVLRIDNSQHAISALIGDRTPM